MKILNFTAVEVLPALLNKSKTQTIRVAFCENCGTESHWVNKKRGRGCRQLHLARFSVGEKARLMWNQRSKYPFFDKNGNGCSRWHGTFGKNRGIVEMTEVFKINMGSYGDNNRYSVGCEEWDDVDSIALEIRELARRDGFKTADEMFAWFHKKYDLTQEKDFWVYRWRWL